MRTKLLISVLVTSLIIFLNAAYTKPAKKEKAMTEINHSVLMKYGR
jgi:hypothetical protein